MEILTHTAAVIVGLLIVVATIMSAVKTFILPRSAQTRMTFAVFITLRKLFDASARFMQSYEQLDRLFSLYAPIGLLALPAAWLASIAVGFTLIFWGLGVGTFYQSYVLSGSSLLTLGFASASGWALHTVLFIEGGLGLGMVALFISYLPTMYGAFSRREALVSLLEVRAGTPPSALEMLRRYHSYHGLDHLSEVWDQWEAWFVEIGESHTSLTAVSLFRSPHPFRNWVTAAGTVLDCAGLLVSVVDIEPDPHVNLCIRAGYLAVNSIAVQFAGVRLPEHPTLEKNEISISREEFDAACEELVAKGIPLKADREKAWRDFAGWRVNYDAAILLLSRLLIAPLAPWTSDRAWRKEGQGNIARIMRQEQVRPQMR